MCRILHVYEGAFYSPRPFYPPFLYKTLLDTLKGFNRVILYITITFITIFPFFTYLRLSLLYRVPRRVEASSPASRVRGAYAAEAVYLLGWFDS